MGSSRRNNESGWALPLVSIITINFNHSQVTGELLESLKSITYPNVEIIVVDNGSADDSVLSLYRSYPGIKIIQSGKNLGFAGGNNIGINASSGEYILLINNDVEVTPQFLEPMVETLMTVPRAGLASPKIVYFNRDETIQYAGSSSINSFTGRGKRIGYLQRDNGYYDCINKTELGHGACLLVSRAVIETIGLLPEMYFLYYEEHDWTEKAKSAGFDVYYVGKSKVYHKESISTGNNSPLKTFYLSRNRLLYHKRNTSGFTNFLSVLFILGLAVPKNTFKFLMQRDFKNLKAYFHGIWSYMNYDGSSK